jgi:hypothetical protein
VCKNLDESHLTVSFILCILGSVCKNLDESSYALLELGTDYWWRVTIRVHDTEMLQSIGYGTVADLTIDVELDQNASDAYCVDSSFQCDAVAF